MTEELRLYLREQAISLEKLRKKYVRYNYGFKLISLLKTILGVAVVILGIINFIFPLLIPALVIGVIAYILLNLVKDPNQLFLDYLKKDVLPTIFRKINPTFIYKPEGYNQDSLKASGFLTKSFFDDSFRIWGEDFVQGKIENIDVEFFEVNCRKEVINYGRTVGGCLLAIVLLPVIIIRNIFTDSDMDDLDFEVSKDIKVILRGFFMKADFNKEFKGKVYMIPKSSDGSKYKTSKPNSLDLMSVENPYINDNYTIYTSDSQLGYYVLSQSLIDRIQQIAEKESALPTISFINGEMYYLIPWDKDLFTSDLSKSIEDENYFVPYIEEIRIFEKTIKDLSLDQRIWSKV